MQAAFVGRSEYFRALFRDHFRETSRTDVCDTAIQQKDKEREGRTEIDLLTLHDVTPEVTFLKNILLSAHDKKSALKLVKLLCNRCLHK